MRHAVKIFHVLKMFRVSYIIIIFKMYHYILYIYPEIDYNLCIVLFLNSDCKNSIVKAITVLVKGYPIC